MNANKTIGIVAIIAIIVSVGWNVIQLRSTVSEPDWMLKMPEEKADVLTGKLYTKSRGEWKKLTDGDGNFKNPDTGKYTLRKAIVCQTCGEKIPMFPLPSKEAEAQGEAAVNAEIRKYKCPKCGSFPLGGGGASPQAPAGEPDGEGN